MYGNEKDDLLLLLAVFLGLAAVFTLICICLKCCEYIARRTQDAETRERLLPSSGTYTSSFYQPNDITGHDEAASRGAAAGHRAGSGANLAP